MTELRRPRPPAALPASLEAVAVHSLTVRVRLGRRRQCGMPDTPSPQPADAPAPQPAARKQANNPLHGVTLEKIVTALAEHYGWAGLGERLPLRCFTHEPSVASSLKLLRKTPWAREKVESLYLFMLREQRREAKG